MEIKAGRGIDGKDFVYLDLRHIGLERIRSRLPFIYEESMRHLKIDCSKEPIPVRPTVHYSMGGIPTSTDGEVLLDAKGTVLPGFFAAGECACVSVHGANRLGCNSLLETIVFGKRAGMAMTALAAARPMPAIRSDWITPVQRRIKSILARTSGERTGALREEMQEVMQADCGVFRDKNGLMAALKKIRSLQARYVNIAIDDKGIIFNTDLQNAIELGSMLTYAQIIVASALHREESRGAHYRSDFPKRDDKTWLKHILAKKEGDKIIFDERPVTIEGYAPKERSY